MSGAADPKAAGAPVSAAPSASTSTKGDAGTGTESKAEHHGLPSHWKRRIFVLVMYAIAVTLLVVHFTILVADVDACRFRVDSEINKLDKDTVVDQKQTLVADFKELEKKSAIDRVVLVAAFGFGLAALTIGGIWSVLETMKGAREAKAAAKAAGKA